MTTLICNNKTIVINNDQSVLEALEQSGIRIPNSCRKGVCQSCLLRAEGVIPAASQQGLRYQQVVQGYFLACCCYPTQPLTIVDKPSANKVDGVLLQKHVLSTGKGDDIAVLLIEAEMVWQAGQYIDVFFDEHTARPYSIASRCDDKRMIELHIKRHSQGVVSRWLCDELTVGDSLPMSHAKGDCCYVDDDTNEPLLMVATGTGLAPIYGVLQEALHQKHCGEIYLYHGAGEAERLYYQRELAQLSAKYPHVHIYPVVKRVDSQEQAMSYSVGDIVDVVKQQHPDMHGYQVFLCGAPLMVNTLQRACFFQGASISNIHTDAFDVAAKPVT